jgi:hypothetical protein
MRAGGWRIECAATLGVAVMVLGPWSAPEAGAALARMPLACSPGPDYYAIPLITTKNLPGTGYAEGTAEVAHAPSPFSVTLAEDGSYRHTVTVTLRRMQAPHTGVLVAWVTTRELDRTQRLGALGPDLTARGEIDWNKFIVVISHEATDDPDQERWAGPIALRGMSRSGMMHTMAGHGAFQQENCAAYGYEE